MVIVQHNYSGINKPKMTDSFLIQLSDIKEIYDVDEGVIGLKFARFFSTEEYKIELEGDYKKMLASELLDLLIQVEDRSARPPVIHGGVKRR